MAFTQQPATQCSAYRPVKFRFESGTTSDAVEKLVVEVWNAATTTLIASYRKDWTSRTGSGPTYNYLFDFDISGLLQAIIDPIPSARSGVMADPGALTGLAANASIGVYVKAQLEIRNTDNLLETSGSQVTSDTLYAFNIVRQHTDAQDLNDFVTADPRKVLNGSTGPIPIREDETFFVCFIAKTGIAKARFTLRKRDGTTVTANAPGAPPSLSTWADKRICFYNVGPRAANSYFTLDLATYSGYDVFIADASNNPITETLSFDLVEHCEANELRLQWLNSKGGADGYTFNAVRRTGTAVKSDTSEKPLTWGFSSFDYNQRGKYRTNVQIEEFWEVETRVIDESEANYVAGLFTSPECYIERVGDTWYIPALISDARIIESDSEEVGVILKAVITLANEKRVQRY